MASPISQVAKTRNDLSMVFFRKSCPQDCVARALLPAKSNHKQARSRKFEGGSDGTGGLS